MSKDTPLPREWVTITEAADLTGYHRDHIQRLARDESIVAQLTAAGYLILLPSLYEYMRGLRRGPQPDRKPKDEG